MKKTTTIFLFICLFIYSFAQNGDNTDTLLHKLETYQKYNLTEKVYLHLDRPTYSAGEDIWFKGYVTIAPENILSGWSKVLYVDLIDMRDELVQNIVLPITAGIAYGDFALSDTLAEGSYRLRAYTRWMQNFSEDFFYDRTIYVTNGRGDNTKLITAINKDENKENEVDYRFTIKTQNDSPIANTKVQYRIVSENKQKKKGQIKSNEKGEFNIPVKGIDTGNIELSFPSFDGRQIHKYIKIKELSEGNKLQFFPEGGYLLDQTESKIAFKATDKNGKGIPVQFTLKDEDENEVLYVESDESGMGSFVTTLSKNSIYSAFAQFSDGKEQTFSLPEIVSEGVSVLMNTFSSEQLIGKVNLAGKYKNYKNLVILLQKDGLIYNLSKITPKTPEFVFRIEKSEIPSGVFQLSILNEDFHPIVERFVFNYNPDKNLKITSKLDKESYSTREKVNVNIMAKSNSMDSIPQSSLSASVVNLPKDIAEKSEEQSLLASLLLMSDVKGYIENPGKYFENLDEIDLIGLDNLLLTQGWRKLVWQKIDSLRKPEFEVENSLKISGTIHKLGRKATEAEAKVDLISTHNFMDFIDTLSDENGHFVFDDLLFPDSIQFLISAKTKKGKNRLDIKMDEPAIPAIHKSKNSPDEIYDVNRVFQEDLQSSVRHLRELERQGLKDEPILIEEVVINKRIEKKADENSSNLNGVGNADYILTSEDMERCPTLAICLQAVPGVVFQNGIPYSTRSMQGPPMQIVVDGMYLEAEDISIIDPMDVASIEVLRTPHYLTIYGTHGAGGLLIITTKRGTGVRSNRKPIGLITHNPKGFYVSREFYSPDYDDEVKEEAENQQDLRKTIHWEPLIVTDEQGNANFDFYTSDEKGKYIIQVKGMDLKGNLGENSYSFEVK